MTDPDQDLLTTREGVDEGSAASTAEDAGSGGHPGAGSTPTVGGEAAAPPDEVGTEQSRAAQETGTGQQLEAGEG